MKRDTFQNLEYLLGILLVVVGTITGPGAELLLDRAPEWGPATFKLVLGAMFVEWSRHK